MQCLELHGVMNGLIKVIVSWCYLNCHDAHEAMKNSETGPQARLHINHIIVVF